MILQAPISSPPLFQRFPFSSTSSYSQSVHILPSIYLPTHRIKNTSIPCWNPQVHSYNTVDRERAPKLKWTSLYRRISFMENPELGADSVLDLWEKEGRRASKWELCRVVKELRKFGRVKLALEVYEWMNEREDKYVFNSSDVAIQLDLISKVHGINIAKEYFSKLQRTLKDKRTYGSLLNAYSRARMEEEAESLMKEMKDKGYASYPLPYNVMMTLYLKLKKYDKAISMVSEMMEKNVSLDLYSYNIWLSACGAMKSTENMEAVLRRMQNDSKVNPNWTTYSTVATLYINLGLVEKAIASLRMMEGKITGRERIPFHYLLSLYGGLGMKDDVYRIWKTYKSSFSNVTNLGYHQFIAALVRLDDIEGAEKTYDEWLSVRSTFDPRLCNLLIGWYAKNGLLQKAKDFLDGVFEVGGKANPHTWELIAEGHIKESRLPDAFSCMKLACSTKGTGNWKPNPAVVVGFLKLCEKESDMAKKEELKELLKAVGCFEKVYPSLFNSTDTTDIDLKLSVDKDGNGSDNDDDDDGTDILLNQLERAL